MKLIFTFVTDPEQGRGREVAVDTRGAPLTPRVHAVAPRVVPVCRVPTKPATALSEGHYRYKFTVTPNVSNSPVISFLV